MTVKGEASSGRDRVSCAATTLNDGERGISMSRDEHGAGPRSKQGKEKRLGRPGSRTNNSFCTVGHLSERLRVRRDYRARSRPRMRGSDHDVSRHLRAARSSPHVSGAAVERESRVEPPHEPDSGEQGVERERRRD